MAIDLNKLGYSGIFFSKGGQISLPAELTKTWWDKKKQIVAKMTRATGVGAELESLRKVFEKVMDWPHLGENPVTLPGGIEKAKKFLNSDSNLKAFRDELKKVRDLCKEESVELKKSALTKKTGEVLDEMAKAADAIFIAVNQNSLSSQLSDALVDVGKILKEKAIKGAGPTISAAKQVASKIPAALKAINESLEVFKKNPDAVVKESGKDVVIRSGLGNGIRNLCRDITQPLGNTLKASKAGVHFKDFDQNKAQTLFDQMSVISDSGGASEFMGKLDGSGAGTLVTKLDGWCKSFVDLCGDLKIDGKVG